MLTLPVPVLVSVTLPDAELPTATAPRLRLLGLALNSIVGGAVPLPDSITTVGPLVAVLATVTLPDTEPADVGAKVTEKVRFWPGARVMGRVRGLALKPAPVTLGC